MEITYGDGFFIEGSTKIEGRIILSEHKLYLKSPTGDLTRTYIPLEKIEWIKCASTAASMQVRPTISYRYVATIQGDRRLIKELVIEIVGRRGFRKKFLRNEWVEVPE